jgi:3-oxoacyl-[acyl-carrier protein] reductase
LKLANKVAIVTAAGGAGIGQAAARVLAREGADVIVSDTHAERVKKVAEDIRASFGRRTLGIKCDVADREQVEQMVKVTLESFGKVDILVNNAGRTLYSSLVDMTDEMFEFVINVNLRGTFYCCRAVLPSMIKQKSGSIINISSADAWIGDKNMTHYCAAKAGVLGFTRALAAEVGPFNIRVNAIAPGLIMNPFLEGKVVSKEYLDNLINRTVVGRAGVPSEIGEVVAFLASEEASYVTGQTLCVSGGAYMH